MKKGGQPNDFEYITLSKMMTIIIHRVSHKRVQDRKVTNSIRKVLQVFF